MSTFKITDYDRDLGIKTTVHGDGDRVTIEKSYDAEPMLIQAAAARQQTDGERWGEMRHVGFIPMAELGKMMRQDGGLDHKRLLEFLRNNPAFVTFSKVLKT